MHQVLNIKAGYDWMIEAHRAEYTAALMKNDQIRQDRLDRNRDHLERGIFILLFAQFEVALNASFERIREARQANPDWTVRRGWDTPEVRRKRPAFEARLALMLDRNTAEYSEITAAYGVRNACAHVRTSTSVGSIDQLVKDLYRWQTAL